MTNGKQDFTGVETITVPFIPAPMSDVISLEEAMSFGKRLPKEFKLEVIEGTRLTYFEDTDEWLDLGHNAVFRRQHDR